MPSFWRELGGFGDEFVAGADGSHDVEFAVFDPWKCVGSLTRLWNVARTK